MTTSEAPEAGRDEEARALRRRVAVELGVLGALTTAFLVAFPHRPTPVDIGLALFALGAILVTSRDTRDRVWGARTADEARAGRRASARLMLALTLPLVAVFLAVGAAVGARAGGAAGVAERLLTVRLPLALALYLPWALCQQALFQFYLLGRLRALLPEARAVAIVLTGVAYGLVHLPDLATTSVTVAAGIVWSFSYERHRSLVPIAASHALLGSTFYYWVIGRDVLGMAAAAMGP